MDEEFKPVFLNQDAAQFGDNGESCLFNNGVRCTSKFCAKCGWNPRNVGLRNWRKRKIMEARKSWLDGE